MCTALTLTTSDTYFGRNLDLEYAYKEEIVVTPRRFPLTFRRLPSCEQHYAMIGTAYVPDGFPLYYDAVNEHGLAMAGLNFPRYAQYTQTDGEAVAPFEVIPFVLSRCKSVTEACALLRSIPIVSMDYSEALSVTPLHWLISDATESVAVEPTNEGLRLTSNPVGVLTNSPPLDYHLTRLASFTTLTPHTPPENFADVAVPLYSRGMGSEGLPGGYSSAARFVRAAYTKGYAVCDGSEAQSVTQVFHILDSVAHPRGCVVMPDGRCEITVYSSCCNLRTGMYYYKTYNGSQMHAASLCDVNLDERILFRHPMEDTFAVTPHVFSE